MKRNEVQLAVFDSAENRGLNNFLLRNARELIKYRHVLYNLVNTNLRARYRRSVIGFFWSLLNPLFTMIILAVVFSTIYKLPFADFGIYIFSGLLPWSLISNGILSGSISLVGAEGYLKKVYVPKMIFPIATVGVEAVNFLFSLVSLSVLALFLGAKVSWGLLFLPVALLCTVLFVLGIILIVSIVNVYFRDLFHILQIVFTGLFYLVPIVYKKELFTGDLSIILRINPFVYFIELFHQIIYEAKIPDVKFVVNLWRVDVGQPYCWTACFQIHGEGAHISIMNTFVDLKEVFVKFRIYHNPIPSLKDLFVNRVNRKKNRDDYTEFYGLNNVTLEIKPGDRLGIVGLNGAGKSTLLKTIAGIYSPHQGRVRVQGRITPLMELGAGFDAEQTGRENIFLNGALLGFSPAEMREKEQAIADFSELKEFLDMPVKYYSSGMYGRLAFSIATMTQADILLIDEVFATGDAHFVEKSSQRILQLLEQSQIVVIVSHSLDQIQKLCNRAIVLEKGVIVNDGDPKEMIEYYNRTYIHP